jgi:hypothetical protein
VSASTCPNCATPRLGPWCHRCGQKEIHPGDLTLKHAGHHLFHETFHLDGRVFSTLKVLFARPGQLSLDFLEGRRQRHPHPVRLFLLMAALYFVLGNATVLRLEHIEARAPRVARLYEANAQALGMSKAAFVESRNPKLQTTYKLAVIASVVAVGGLQALLFRRRLQAIGAHLTVAAHNASAAFALSIPLGWLMVFVPYAWASLLPATLATGVYDYFAFRRVYGGSAVSTLWKVVLIVVFSSAWAWLAMFGAFRWATSV